MSEQGYDTRCSKAEEPDGLLAHLDIQLDQLENAIVRYQDRVRVITAPYSVPGEPHLGEEALTPARERILRLRSLIGAMQDTTDRLDI